MPDLIIFQILCRQNMVLSHRLSFFPALVSDQSIATVDLIIFLILSFIFNSLFNKIKNYLHTSISSYEQRTAKIQEKNDLIMKEKQMQAKNTHVVICSHCGASNMLTSTTGKCKYCRNIIQ